MQLPGVEVWFQRASDCVRKLMYGDVDIVTADGKVAVHATSTYALV